MALYSPQEIKLKTNEKIILRSATPEDAKECVDIVNSLPLNASYSANDSQDPPTPAERYAQKYAEGLECPLSLFLVAQHFGNIIGILDAKPGLRQKNRHSITLGLTIDENWRNKGVGSVMMQEYFLWAKKQKDILRLQLVVWEANSPARHLYEKMGFQVEGIKRKVYRLADGTFHNQVLMGLLLNGEISNERN